MNAMRFWCWGYRRPVRVHPDANPCGDQLCLIPPTTPPLRISQTIPPSVTKPAALREYPVGFPSPDVERRRNPNAGVRPHEMREHSRYFVRTVGFRETSFPGSCLLGLRRQPARGRINQRRARASRPDCDLHAPVKAFPRPKTTAAPDIPGAAAEIGRGCDGQPRCPQRANETCRPRVRKHEADTVRDSAITHLGGSTSRRHPFSISRRTSNLVLNPPLSAYRAALDG